MTKVKTLQELRSLVAQGNHRYVVLLNYGIKSVKRITINRFGGFSVIHEIDGSRTAYNDDSLADSKIGQAMRSGSFYCD